MRLSTILLCGVALASALAPGAAFAGSAPPMASAADLDRANANIDQLNARIDALEAELQAAEQRSADDHNALSGLGSAASGWWSDTSVNGRMYWDVSYVDQETNGTRTGTSNGTAFDIKRFYVGIDHKFNDTFSANVTTDFTYDSGSGTSQIYIKKAYLQAKVDDALVIRVGSTDLPWVPFVEDVYGMRYVENTLADRLKYGTSADWGVHFSGKILGGALNYAFSVVNGAGYKKAGVFRTNGPDMEGRISTKFDDFTLAVGGYIGHLGVQYGGAIHHSATRFDALAAWTPGPFKLGVEFFEANNYLSVSSTTQTDHATGVSGFTAYKFAPEWTVFGRYDYAKKHINALIPSSVPDNYYNVGIEWNPTKIIDFSLVYKHDQASHGSFSTSNGTIGGSTNGNYSEIGIFGQVRW